MIYTIPSFDRNNITLDTGYFDFIKKSADEALDLGIHAEPVQAGTNGTYFIKDSSKKNIAVFKPGDEEALAKNSPKLMSRIKRIVTIILPFFKTLVFCAKGNGYKAEAAASTFNRELELDLVPTTKIVQLKDDSFNYRSEDRKKPEGLPKKEGSFQLYIHEKCSLAETALKINRWWCLIPRLAKWHYNKPKQREKLEQAVRQDDFEKMAIFDFAIGNIDRHFGNWFVTENGRIYLFDNGNAFTEKHSDSFISRLNQYTWAILPQAQVPFSKEAQALITKIYSKKESLIATLMEQGQINARQAHTMSERITVLNMYKDKTSADLAKIKSTKDFQRILA